jgi:hypothetical protein
VSELAVTVDELPQNAIGKIDLRLLVKIGSPIVERLPR